jgi:hypothetical protein
MNTHISGLVQALQYKKKWRPKVALNRNLKHHSKQTLSLWYRMTHINGKGTIILGTLKILNIKHGAVF